MEVNIHIFFIVNHLQTQTIMRPNKYGHSSRNSRRGTGKKRGEFSHYKYYGNSVSHSSYFDNKIKKRNSNSKFYMEEIKDFYRYSF